MEYKNQLLVLIVLNFSLILIVQSFQMPPRAVDKFKENFGKNHSSSINKSSNSNRGGAVADFFTEANSFPIPQFRITNLLDGLSLTIEGVNASYARVVGENFNAFKEQKWEIKKVPSIANQSIYGLFPLRYTYNSALTYHKDPAQKYPSIVSWEVKKVNTSTMNKHPEIGYQFINERTKQCLRSEGRRRAVVELKCDVYDKKQLWKIVKI